MTHRNDACRAYDFSRMIFHLNGSGGKTPSQKNQLSEKEQRFS
jgi:hypothetical protein